jgi:hypothetical protein
MGRRIIKYLLRFAWLAVALNELRGIVFAAPVFYVIFTTQPNAVKIAAAIAILGGIALSVVVPAVVIKWVERKYLSNT